MEQTYEVSGGVLLVQAHRAQVDRHSPRSTGRVDHEVPLLHVTGEVKYRNRVYVIDRVWRWGKEYHRGDYVGDGWVGVGLDNGIKRKVQGTSVDMFSLTFDVLESIAKDVSDRFIADHPDWEWESLALHYRWLIERADSEVQRLTRQLNAVVAEAARLRSQFADKI